MNQGIQSRRPTPLSGRVFGVLNIEGLCGLCFLIVLTISKCVAQVPSQTVNPFPTDETKPTSGRDRGYLNFIASINFSRSIASTQFVSQSDVPKQPKPVPISDVSIRILNTKGVTLNTYPVLVTEESDRRSGDDRIGLARVSFPAMASMAVLEVLYKDQVISRSSLTETSEPVANLATHYGVDINEADRRSMTKGGRSVSRSSIFVNWDAKTNQNPPPTYTLEISTDGKVWSTLALSLSRSFYEIVPADLGLSKGERVAVRVAANTPTGKSKPAVVTFEVR
jgi:hypothetical protein